MSEFSQPLNLEAPPAAEAEARGWPAVLAFALAFLFWGIITSRLLSLVGLLLFIIALAGWIGEMRHE